MKDVSDGELMNWIAQGNQKAFQEIYQRYGAHVLGYSRRLLKNAGTAEEVSQEVWIKVVRSAASYRREGSVKSWLYTVTRRTAFNFLRDHATPQEISNEDLVQSAADPTAADFETQLMARAEVKDVRRALDELPDNQRLALTLWLTEDMTYEQIAAQMGLSESAIKSLLHRARVHMETRIRGAS